MLVVATTLAVALAAAPPAREVAGVTVAEQVTLAGRSLVLNGAGLRRVILFEVYVAALYLGARSDDGPAILAADAPWLLRLTFRRDVDHDRIIEAFVHAFEQNSPGQLEQLRADLEHFHAILRDFRRDEEMTVHYQPGQGTTLTVPGGATATVAGRLFGAAILRTFLGEHPADPGLKEAMLGR
jgi:hypothetical protein